MIFFRKKTNIGKPPGTIIYNGKYKDEKTAIEKISYSEDFFKKENILDIESYEKNKINYWYNITGYNDEKILKKIANIFEINLIDLEDIVECSDIITVNSNNDYLFSSFKMIYLDGESLIHENISFVLLENNILTFQEKNGDVFENVRNRLKIKKQKIRKNNIEYLFFSLLDSIIDEYFNILNYMYKKFKKIELKMIDNKKIDDSEFYSLRKELLYFSNIVFSASENLKKILKIEDFLDKDLNFYYNDLLNNLEEIKNKLNFYRSMLDNLNDIYVSKLTDNTNQIMMTLTIFSVLFIPLSFLTGVFGMNFKYIPGLNNPDSFHFFIFACVFSISLMIIFIKQKKWY